MIKSLLKSTALTIGIISVSFLQAQPTWQQVLNDFNTYSITSTINGYVFGCDGQAMQKSTTGAPSSFVNVPNFPNTGYSNYIITNYNILFLATHSFSYLGRGIYVSYDFGNTWLQKNNGLGGDTCIYSLQKMANGVMIACATTGFSYKLYRSTDNGNSWTFTQNVGGYMESIVVRSATEAYMCDGGGFYKSTDNGLTWTSIYSSTSFYNLVIPSSGNFYATTYNGIMKSIDNGVTWTNVVTTGLPATFQSGAFIKAPGDTIYYSNIGSPYGLYYSTNSCSNWTACVTGLPAGPLIYRDGLNLSTNGYLFSSPSSSGMYRTSAKITHSTVGIAENLFAQKISIYPNPTADKITITSDHQGTCMYTLYDDKGAKLFSRELSAQEAEIDLTEFPSGIYLLEINQGSESTVKKIVRE